MVMFWEILRTLIRIVVVFFFLILAFGLSFFVLLGSQVKLMSMLFFVTGIIKPCTFSVLHYLVDRTDEAISLSKIRTFYTVSREKIILENIMPYNYSVTILKPDVHFSNERIWRFPSTEA